MLITISLLILAYMILGKDVSSLLERVKNIDWRGKINALMDKIRPWAFPRFANGERFRSKRNRAWECGQPLGDDRCAKCARALDKGFAVW